MYRIKNIGQYGILYMMLAPCIIFFIIFAYIPMLWLLLAFKEFRFDQTLFQFQWVGFQYFANFFSYYRSWELIRNTLVIGFIKVILLFPFPIIFALMLNKVANPALKKSIQTISYLPHFISWVVVATILQKLLAPDIGIINSISQLFGAAGERFFLMEAQSFYPIMAFSELWKTVGWSSIIYLATISNISPTLYDAARIDGASSLQETRYITLPSLKETAGLLFLLGLGNILSTGFEQIYLLRTPGNQRLADTLDVYVIQEGLKQANFSYATAVSLVQGLVGLMFILIVNKLAKETLEVSLW